MFLFLKQDIKKHDNRQAIEYALQAAIISKKMLTMDKIVVQEKIRHSMSL